MKQTKPAQAMELRSLSPVFCGPLEGGASVRASATRRKRPTDMFLLLLLGCVAMQAWAWVSLRRRIVSGSLTRLGAIVRYTGWAVAPLVLLAALFFGAVGLEEVTGAAVLPELIGRAALPAAAVLLGLAGLGAFCFCVQVAFVTPRAHSKA